VVDNKHLFMEPLFIVFFRLLIIWNGLLLQADRTFLEHLSNTAYLKSTECKLAEDFLQAFKQMDVDLLDEAQRSHHLIHLDRDVQNLARKLSLMANHNAPEPIVTSAPKGSSGGIKKPSPSPAAVSIPVDRKPAAVAEPAPSTAPVVEDIEEDLEELVVSGGGQQDDDDDEIDLC
jgi:gluconate kinase